MSKTLVKIKFTYTDGSSKKMIGIENCAIWEKSVIGQAQFCQVHGIQFPDLPWVEVPVEDILSSTAISFYLNGKRIISYSLHISYERLIELCGQPDGSTITIHYKNVNKSLCSGETIELETGMVFNVSDISNA